MIARVYLAGPDVFYPDALERSRLKKEICARYGLEGLSPLDNEAQVDPADPGRGASIIYSGNVRQMDAADAIIANLTPFRGVSADVGTAFEVGYCAARRLPVFGYSLADDSYVDRVRESAGLTADALRDGQGMAIENVGHADNLMLVEAIRSSGGRLVDRRSRPDVASELQAFELCAEALAGHMRGRRQRSP